MPAKYVPGAENPYFARHKYHGIPVDRNIRPIQDCKLHHCVGPAATVRQAIAVPILTPEHLWGTFQAEAEAIITVNGSLEGNDRERNKRINAAYAKLWLADNRFQWAGLAAFASKQSWPSVSARPSSRSPVIPPTRSWTARTGLPTTRETTSSARPGSRNPTCSSSISE